MLEKNQRKVENLKELIANLDTKMEKLRLQKELYQQSLQSQEKFILLHENEKTEK
jgi:hypothetical protein